MDAKVGRLEEFGLDTMSQLTKEIVANKMPHLAIPEVKQSYDEMMKLLPPNMKANPEALQNLYTQAVGKNTNTILALKQEEWLRAQAESPATQDPGASGGARGGAVGAGANGIPKPEDVLDKENIKAIRALGKTPDSYYQSMGYSGWADFWEKTGKDYFEPEGEE